VFSQKSSSAKGRKPTHVADAEEDSEFRVRKLPEGPKVGVFSGVAVLAANLGKHPPNALPNSAFGRPQGDQGVSSQPRRTHWIADREMVPPFFRSPFGKLE
jgi:hypothetical protein